MLVDAEAIERYRLRLRYKASYHLGKFCPDIDDVVQETLMRFLRAAREDRIHNPASIGAFLSATCNNVISEYRRRLWREDAEAITPEREPFVAAEARHLEDREAVAATLAQMSDRDCEILRAFFLEERDRAEICRRLNLPEQQFRVVLFRAKDRFRKIYEQRLKRAGA